MSEIGEILKQLRKQKKMTQSELAEGIVNRSYISQIEKNLVQPSFKTVTLLAKKLNVDISLFYENIELKALSESELKNQIKNAKYHLEINNQGALSQSVGELENISEEAFDKLNGIDKTEFHFVLASYYFQKDNLEKCMEYAQKGLQLAQENGLERKEIDFLLKIAKVHIEENDFHVSLTYLNQANNIILSNRLMDLVKVDVLLNMGICHGRIGEYYSAIRLCEEALHINSITQSTHKSGELFMTLGICYRNVHDLEQSQKFYEKAMQYFDLFEQSFNKAGILINLAILFREKNDIKKCIELIKEAKQIFIEMDNDYQVLNCDVELFKTNVIVGNFSSIPTDFKKIDELIPNDYKTLKRDLHTAMIDFYFNSKQYRDALVFLTESQEITSKNLYLAKIFYNLKMWEDSSVSFMEYFEQNLP